MSDTYKALLIKDGEISPIDLRKSGDGAHHARELIGGWLCQCFVVPISPTRALIAYCDDEGLLKEPQPPVNVLLTNNLYDWAPPGYPIHGPIVVTAVRAPDTVDMTDAERSRFYIEESNGQKLLRYRWDEHGKERVWHPERGR